jgi:hypothetical protein
MTINRKPFLFLFLLSACWGCRTETRRTDNTGMAAETYPTFSPDGAWCWFSDPRAIFYEGKHRRTYTGWVDSLGDIVVGYYDHDNGRIKTKIIAEHFQRDDHDDPSFLIDPDGKLMVFYSKHAGQLPILLARAKTPEDISAWEKLDKLALNDTVAYAGLSDTYTYTNIVRLQDEKNKLYLFWRGADFKPNFSTSSDFGRTWETGKVLVLPERIYRDRRPYMKVASNNKDVIHFAFTDGHPNREETNSIYYAQYRKGALYKANGDKIADWSAVPVDPRQVDVVYDARVTKERAWVWDVAEGKNGAPVIVYSRFPSDSSHVYYYSIFDSGHWNNYKLVDSGRWFPQTPEGSEEREPNYSGGLTLDHADPSQVYLSREKDGVFEIEKWTTADKGKSWNVTEITTKSAHDNVRPVVIRNHPTDGPRVLWMNINEYRHYTDFRTGIKMDRR